jgi:hypothetical protein
MAGFLESLHHFAGVEVNALEKTVRLRPSLPRAWTHVRCRSRVADTCFDIDYQEPSSRQRSLTVRPVDAPPDGCRISLGFRLPPDTRIMSASCNGAGVAPDAWSYQEGCAPGVPGEAWLSMDWEGDVTLEAEIGGS